MIEILQQFGTLEWAWTIGWLAFLLAMAGRDLYRAGRAAGDREGYERGLQDARHATWRALRGVTSDPDVPVGSREASGAWKLARGLLAGEKRNP
jgi:hypothetical protein